MQILVAHNIYYSSRDNERIPTYATCMVDELRNQGYGVIEIQKKSFDDPNKYSRFDALIEIDSGRDIKGKESWHLLAGKIPIPTVAFLIDSHGKPDLHAAIAKNATHVFYAVHNKRDLFKNHPSAHWSPNFTDLKWFGTQYVANYPAHDIGFFGSKGGLDRADKLKVACQKLDFSFNVAEVGRKGKHTRWPDTAYAMGKCRALFNHGQKHDDPNLRVMESMAMGLPLITPQDPLSGMGFLFEPWHDYIPYYPYSYEGLDKALQFTLRRNEKAAAEIAKNGQKKVHEKHLTKNRIDQIMEVLTK